MGPPGGDVRLVGALVVGEACVAIDAKEGFFGGADELRREVEHGLGHRADHREHGLFEFGLEDRFARGKPLAVVVADEVAEEFDGFRTKIWQNCGWIRF